MSFVVTKVGLEEMPPFLLAALRFMLVAFPAILFLARPKIPMKWLLAYALSISLGQFSFLFSAISAGMPAGIASLVIQAQAFFTVGLSALVFGDKLKWANLLGMLVASIGLLLLMGGSSLVDSAGSVPLHAFVLTLCAAVSLAIGNVINKKIGKTEVLNLVVWSALTPILPFLILSWIFEGPSSIRYSLTHFSLSSALTILYLALASTLIAFTLWGKLLTSLPTHIVAPLPLLVPVISLTGAWIFLGEALLPTQLLGTAIVLIGLLINIFGHGLIKSWRRVLT